MIFGIGERAASQSLAEQVAVAARQRRGNYTGRIIVITIAALLLHLYAEAPYASLWWAASAGFLMMSRRLGDEVCERDKPNGLLTLAALGCVGLSTLIFAAPALDVMQLGAGGIAAALVHVFGAIVHAALSTRGAPAVFLVSLSACGAVLLSAPYLAFRDLPDGGAAMAGVGGGAALFMVYFLYLWRRMEADYQNERVVRAELEAAASAKSQFLALMSHEIRTPLNGVLGLAQNLTREELSPGARAQVALILDCGQSLLSVLNDVLDQSKMEAGRMELAPAPTDLRAELNTMLGVWRARATDKGLDLRLEIDEAIPPTLEIDAMRLRQCMSNLVSNAIKFTDRGSVTLRARDLGRWSGRRRIEISVSDTGSGIEPEVLARLFRPFEQGDPTNTRQFGGTGLGLAITRSLAQLMGGDVRARSTPGQGSVFALTFLAEECGSLASAAEDAGGCAQTQAAAGLRILLADDIALNRTIVKLFLNDWDASIVEAENGEEVLKALGSQCFDLVLLDIHMPVMSGDEALRRMRASKEPWAQTPVIVLTADAMPGDRDRVIGLGADGYCPKPVDAKHLYAEMRRVTAQAAKVAA